MTIYVLSPYQIGYLASLFNSCDYPEPHNAVITHMGVSDKTDLIVEYRQYGVLNTIMVGVYDTPEHKGVTNIDNLKKK